MKNCLAYFEDILQNPDIIAGLPRSIVNLRDYVVEGIKPDAEIVIINEPVEDDHLGALVSQSSEYTFQELAENNITFEKNQTLKKISDYSYSLDDKELTNFLKRSLQHINYLLSKYEAATQGTEKGVFIKAALVEIQEELNFRFIPVGSPVATPKIQWLGATNVLTTLIFDLWQGQDKGKNQRRTKVLIKAQKGDLAKMLMDNFVNADGEPLKTGSLSDYLSTSPDKMKSKAKKGSRIELEIPD